MFIYTLAFSANFSLPSMNNNTYVPRLRNLFLDESAPCYVIGKLVKLNGIVLLQSCPKKFVLCCVISPLRHQTESRNLGHTFFGQLCIRLKTTDRWPGTYTNQSYHTAHDKSSLKGDKNGGLRPDLRSSLIVCTNMGATHVLWLACVHCDTEYST